VYFMGSSVSVRYFGGGGGRGKVSHIKHLD
jgi:hypothetical protein